MSKDFYFKVKPKKSALVKSIASIDLPLFRPDADGYYYAGLDIPDVTSPRLVKNNGVFVQGGEGEIAGYGETPLPQSFSPFYGAGDAFSPYYGDVNAYDFSTPEEAYAYRYGMAPFTTPYPWAHDDVSFQTIYCEWDRYRFGNFIIESLIGKSLLHALAYNYFGYPVGNVSRKIDLNYDNDDKTVYKFGRMPNFGTSNPMEAIPEANLQEASAIGSLKFLVENQSGSVSSALANQDPKTLGKGFDTVKFNAAIDEDPYSRYYKMLGASRRSGTAFVKEDEFIKYFTNSHVHEIRSFPGEANFDGGRSPSIENPPVFAPGSYGISGAKSIDYALYKYKEYESGKAPDANFLALQKNPPAGNFQFNADNMQEKSNEAWSQPFQPVTPTQARLWMPSLKTAVTDSPLHLTMDALQGSSDHNITNNSMRRTLWFYGRVEDDDILAGPPAEGPKQVAFDASFKTSNLVSMFKLVPAGISPDKVQSYLDNPHYTLNHILPKVLEYLTQVVPKNPRFAGPKPATNEPDSKTERFSALNMEMPFSQAQIDEGDYFTGCNQLQTGRVMSGSFFEFQVGRKWINAPLLARDPRPTIPFNGELVNNLAHTKLTQPELSADPTDLKYKIGDENSERYGNVGSGGKSVPKKNKDYATKFGLWNNDWIGGASTKYWQKDAQYQPAEIQPNTKGDYYAASAGGFMLLPKNPRTLTSMINSLPSYGIGRQTIADLLDKGGENTSIVATKVLSDLWLSYHLGVKPNGMGFGGNYWGQDDVESIDVPGWNKFSRITFKINRGFDQKIKVLVNAGDGTKDGLKALGGVSYFKQNRYDDMPPLLSEYYNHGNYTAELGKLGVTIPDHTAFASEEANAFNYYQTYYGGYPEYRIAEHYVDQKGYYGAANALLQAKGGYQASDYQKVVGSAGPTWSKNKLQEALQFNMAQVGQVYDGLNVPVFVNRYSMIEFPIWNWYREDNDYSSNLDDINWPDLIARPGSDTSSDYYADTVYKRWEPFIEQNPFLLNQKRECVPRWVNAIRIYPTVKTDALRYGWVPPTLKMSKETIDFTLNGNNYGTAVSDHKDGQGLMGYHGKIAGYDVHDEDQEFEMYTSKDFFIIGEPGAAGGFGQGEQGGVGFYQQQYFSDISSEGFQGKNYKNTNYLPDTCHPYMTLNYEIGNDIVRSDFRDVLDIKYATLSYATELRIDETKLVIDLVKHGIVGLAGESADYVGLDMNLTELFEQALGKADNFYTDTLKKAYETFEAEYLNIFKEDLGVSLDFGVFPTIEVSDRITEEAIQKAAERQLNIPHKVEEYRDQYPKEENIPTLSTPGPISSFIADYSFPNEVPIYTNPGQGSEIKGYVKNFTTVKVLKEWVLGGKVVSNPESKNPTQSSQGQWTKIRILDKEAESNGMDTKVGYVKPEILQPIENGIFFATPTIDSKGNFHAFQEEIDSATKSFNSGRGIYDDGGLAGKKLTLSYTEMKPMSDMARALVPTWWKMTEPFYHYEDGEYWVNVELKGENCIIDESDLDEKSEIAQHVAIRTLLDFYNKVYTDKDIEYMAEAYLVSRTDDYHLDLRPGSSVKFLVKVGAIYLKAFPEKPQSIGSLRAKAPIQLTLNQQYYATHISQALAGLNRMYIEIQSSKYALKGVDLLVEMKRLEFVITIIKKYLSVNGISPTSSEDNLIEVGLNSKYGFEYMAYKKDGESEFVPLLIGLEHFKNVTPFSNPNTMSLLYHHRLLRNPMLKWQNAVKKYFVDPIPEIIEKDLNDITVIPSAPCKPFNFIIPRWEQILGPLAEQLDKQLQLDPKFDFGSFQFSLLSYFPPCPKPPAGKGHPILLGEFEVNGEKYTFEDLDAITAFGKLTDGGAIKEYVGDWVASAGALEDIQHKVIDLDDLMEYVLDYIDPPTLYSKICKCFLDQIGIDTIPVPSLEINASAGSIGANIQPNLGSSALSGENQGEYSVDYKGPSYDGPKSFKDLKETEEMDAGDLICSFCFEIPSFFLRLPTTNIMDILIDALLMALEFILAQLLLELIKALLDILLQCPEITCPEGEKQVKDYGGQDLGEIFSNPSLPPVDNYFSDCGILVDGNEVTGDMVLEMMTNISQRLSSGEVLGLVGGNITGIMLEIAEEEIAKYPEIASQLNSRPRIEDFFSCAGLGLPPTVLADIEDDITDKYQNPELCSNLLADAKKQLSDRCGVSDLYDESAKRALQFDLDKYRALADAIRKNQDLSQQLPSIFGDCQGNQGVLSGLPNPTMDHAISRTVDQMSIPIRETMFRDLTRLQNLVLVSKNPVTEDLLNSSLPTALIKLLTIADNDRRDLLFPASFEGSGIRTASGPYGMPLLSRGSESPAKDSNGEEIAPIDEDLKALQDNIILDKENNSVRVKLKNESEVIMQFRDIAIDDDGVPFYENNIDIKAKIKGMLGQGPGESTQLNLTNLQKYESARVLPLMLQEHLEEFPLDKNSPLPPQAQYFGQLIAKSIGDESIKIPDQLKTTFQEIFSDEIFWSVYGSVFDTFAESIANAELMREYELDRTDDILAGFNPIYILPGVGLMFAFAALAGGDDEINSLVEAAYNGTYYRKEMNHFRIAPQSANDIIQLINFDKVKRLVSDNYDFSRYHDPNSDSLGMPHYAMFRGMISALTQLFVGEAYIKGIIPLSKMPIDIVLQDDALTELVSAELLHYINNGPAGFANIMKEVVEGLFKPCNASLPYVSNSQNPDQSPFPGVAKSQTPFGDVDFEVEDWRDGLRYLVKQDLQEPVPYITSKLNNFTLKREGTGISPINPVQAVSYPQIIQVHDEAFNKELDNTSLSTSARMEAFKDGKFFFQYYFELTELEPGDENYVEALVNRSEKYKGILSADNFAELISKMCDVPLLYPPNTPIGPSALLSVDNDDEQGVNKYDLDVADFFKDIKFGIRWCYGAIYTEALDEDGEPLIKNQPEPVKKMFEAIFDALPIDPDVISSQGSLVSSNYFEVGDFQTTQKNEYLDYAQRTKTLLLAENTNIQSGDDASYGANKLSEPTYTLVMPMFNEKVSIKKGVEGVFDPDDNGKGYQFLNQPVTDANFVSDQLRIFPNAGYGQLTLKHLIDKIALNPAYEGVLRYAFPVPKMCSALIIHSILLATQSSDFTSVFNPTKRIIRTLISKTHEMRGKDNQYKNDFIDPYSSD